MIYILHSKKLLTFQNANCMYYVRIFKGIVAKTWEKILRLNMTSMHEIRVFPHHYSLAFLSNTNLVTKVKVESFHSYITKQLLTSGLVDIRIYQRCSLGEYHVFLVY